MRNVPVESVAAMFAAFFFTCLVTFVTVAATGAARRSSAAGPAFTLRSLYGLEAPRQLAAPRTALVLVDFQDEFFHGRLPLPQAQSAAALAAALVDWARGAGVAVIYVRNEAQRPDSPVFAPGSATGRFVPLLQPRAGDLVITKSVMGAFSRTDLHRQLQARGVDTLIVAGLMTHLAVLATASDATVLGYHTIVAADAVATRALPGAAGRPGVDAPTVQRATLAILADRAADVLTNPAILALPLAPPWPK